MPPHVRTVTLADATAVAPLLAELGYPASTEEVTERLKGLERDAGGEVFAAVDDDGMTGVAHVQLLPVLHSNDRMAQLVLIVVAERARRSGVGKVLVRACEAWAAGRGCKRMLVTSGEERKEAHAFYQAMGYHHYARRFAKRL
ncbi:MAG: GNAT family N-acetyltransferase [Candidatus Latescibacteria bacterium]|nr:GNAT family N-acetyltransferase [Candidatus Latescibacterota bacterium]